MRLVGLQRDNEVNDDILRVMGLWLRITVVLSAVVLYTAIISTAATLIKHTKLPGSASDLTLQGMAMIIGYEIVMLSVWK